MALNLPGGAGSIREDPQTEKEGMMKLDIPMESVKGRNAGTAPDTPARCPDEHSLDGDCPIEGDGGTVDNSSKTQIPPPPPPP